MDWAKIDLLLDIVHKSMNVPGTDNLRAAALKELATLNTPAVAPTPTIADPQLDLKLGARKL